MLKRPIRSVVVRLCTVAFFLLASEQSIGCNSITGANAIDFTRESETAGGDHTSGAGGSGGAGNGDGSIFELSCGEGDVAVGIHGRSGAWLDALGLVCAPVQPDGTLGAVFKTDTAGGNGGGEREAVCPTGQALVGIDISRDNRPVRVINPLCQTLTEWNMPNATTSTVIGLGDAAATSSPLLCPQGSALFKVSVEIGTIPGYVSTFVLVADFICNGT